MLAFRELVGKDLLFFDGAMGTELQAQGLPLGEVPERWNLTHPAVVGGIHRAYREAGATILKTNTFGANAVKLKGTGLTVSEVVTAAVHLARSASAGSAYVALSMGPTGKLLQPFGDLPFEEAVSAFGAAAEAAEAAGADLILIETMSDMYELKAALLGAKEHSSLPVCVTITADAQGKMLTGGEAVSAAALAEALGAEAVGLNCGLGPEQMAEIIPRLKEVTTVPLIANPNAGLPVECAGRTVYKVGPTEFSEAMAELVAQGLSLVGGCCGTTPEHIRAMVRSCHGLQAGGRRAAKQTYVSSYGKAVRLGDGPVLIGERLNPTGKKKLKAAILAKDMDYILNVGLTQVEQGAQVLDVNLGVPGIDEKAMAVATVKELQAILTTPLQIDTASVETMESALRIYNGRPLLNSVNGKAESLRTVLPLARKYGAIVVGLCLDEKGIPTAAAGRLAIAERILQEGAQYGLTKEDFVIDPLALTMSTGQENVAIALEVVATLKEQGVKTILGVSNISFGLPAREAINSTFFTLALNAGLDCAIINPGSKQMLDAYFAFRALKGLDVGLVDYLGRFAQDVTQHPAPITTEQLDLTEVIVRGLSREATRSAQQLLGTLEPLAIINEKIIPALDQVGNGFAEHTTFLPQLLMSADAAKAAFTVLREQMEQAGGREQGETFILATVRGDIHDIGKNIVKALLLNYGYNVIDLGKDVAVETIVEAVREHKAHLVGLSALMTTTVGAMEETIKALAPYNCTTIVGGAVLTEDYAKRIGATAYAKDAVSAVKLAAGVRRNKE